MTSSRADDPPPDDRVGAIETRGIEPVPDSARRGGPLGLFWMWFGANMGVVGLTLGAALVTFSGLDVVQSVIVAVVGSATSFLLVGLLSVAGKRGGAPGLVLSRAVFGVRGARLPTLVSWLGFVGWETVMCTTAAFALLALLNLAGIAAGPVTTAVCVLLVVLVAAVLGLFGHATILWVQKWLTWVFGLLTLVVAGFLVATVDWSAVLARPAGPAGAVVAGVGFVAAGTGLGWLAAGADYARYLPRATSSRRLVGATVLGATIPLVVVISTGALMAVGNDTLASANDPVAAVGAALPGWMLVPYLLTAVAGLVAAADLSMYSSGLNLLAGGIRIPRAAAVVVDAVLITAGGLYVTVVAQDFYGPFTTFLTLLAVPLTAWAAVFLVDLVHREYDPAALLDQTRTSAYWYRGGVRWGAFAAWVAGTAVGLLFTRAAVGETVWFAGPLAGTWIGSNGLGWVVTGVVAAVVMTGVMAGVPRGRGGAVAGPPPAASAGSAGSAPVGSAGAPAERGEVAG